jgi:hypothetical protein
MGLIKLGPEQANQAVTALHPAFGRQREDGDQGSKLRLGEEPVGGLGVHALQLDAA